MRLLKALLKGLLLLAGVAALAMGAFLYRGGAFRTIVPQYAGHCDPLPLPGSAEDIQVDRERGYAYLSLIDRRKLIRGEAVEGTVARVDLNAKPWQVETALLTEPEHFRPHGMSLYIGTDGKRFLFVINHPPHRGVDPEAVEIFRETDPGLFEHQETVMSPLINSPNALVAVGPRQFYLANDKTSRGTFAGIAEQLGWGSSNLVYFDGHRTDVVADDIASGGGINLSADGTTLYVSETDGRRIRVFDRDPPGAGVNERMRIPLDMAPDNVGVSEDGSVTVAGHANVLALIRHFISFDNPAPSEIVRIRIDGKASQVETLYLDDGRTLSASSGGTTYRDMLLIGSITAHQILICSGHAQGS